jgi:hypothetical protein
MHPLVTQVAQRQLRSLRFIYGAMLIMAAGLLLAALLLGPPEEFAWGVGGFATAELVLGGIVLVLLAVAVPLTWGRLASPARVLAADRAQLVRWGLPAELDPAVGRQAVFLTRYSAGCVIAWGLCVSVDLYGLLARLLGGAAWLVGLFFAASTFALLLLTPRAGPMQDGLERMNSTS